MLRRVVVVVLAAAFTAVFAPLALATVICPPGGTVCYVVVDNPGEPGTEPVSGGGGHATPVCHQLSSDVAVPCYDSTFGWWSNADGCYYMRISPPPPATDPAWAGHYPDGAIYESTCPGSGTGGGWSWRPTSPPGYGGGPGTAAELAQEAIAKLELTGPDIGLAPDPSRVGLVGLPVWMWTRVTRATWGPATATASLPGLSVTATARAEKIVWDMGDGNQVTCANPGTPYEESSGRTTSPTCGYSYTTSSAVGPNHTFTVTATTTWAISWQGSAGPGQTTQTRTSSVQVRIGELQVLVS